jgi:hypothetical protein
MYSSRAALNCGAILVFKAEFHKDAGLNTLLEAPVTMEDGLETESVFPKKESEGV